MENSSDNSEAQRPIFSVFRTFLKLGVSSFGGPAAHIGYFRTEFVEKKKWLSDDQFGQLLAICQFLPGPASSQLGFSIGLLKAGWIGALLAFLAFTLPSALLLVMFSYSLPMLSGEISTAVIHGLKIVAFAVIADAVFNMSKTLCPDSSRRLIAISSASIILLASSAWFQILAVLFGAMAGVMWCRPSIRQQNHQLNVNYGTKTSLWFLALFVLLLLMLPILNTSNQPLSIIADVSYRAGALVFGGGHVVLPLLEDGVVNSGLVSKETFLAGYGAAQAVPGPMFSFAAFLGAEMAPQNNWQGASIALAFVFLPGFLLVIAILPLWQSLANNATMRHAISGINASVVGLLGAALYDPVFTSGITSATDMAIGIVALGILAVWRLSPLYVVLWCVLANVFVSLF